MRLFKDIPYAEDICDDLIFTGDERYFEEVFGYYLDNEFNVLSDMMVRIIYDKNKPLLILVLLFLKEEMLRDNYLNSFFELHSFVNATPAEGNKYYLRLKRYNPDIHALNLTIAGVVEDIIPIVNNYKLEKAVCMTTNYNKCINKV